MGNPALMNMATTMLQDPNMQAMMSQMMGGAGGMPGGPGVTPPLAGDPAAQNIEQMMGQMMGGQGGVPWGPAGPGGPPPDMASLLQAGQQLAQPMQQINPELVEQLRRQ